ncbi:glycosyltransferase family 1 protein [Pseudomonas sp. GW456-L14]|uniref:Glycosyltransferase family 4 protein n=1 Tax=Pseudomonas chlororaphis TaxID=587753 RepID=A0AB34BYP3_9PSED|nr:MULTISPECIES: glycosyltransferase family 1 protein [Pseudomonas]KAA5837684.1 glycosyltransferase family 4 protein [Pseudomonas chlororaphis]PMY31120.1 glycosyltransferase family 1 protein [Pseudomonas sp. GW456-L14]PMY48564.1 glycosyltransferase family 1 protein [Pseudomonas sp. GW456-L12]WIE49701.1 glycosyltransferase family 1 protein [Pseudomonas sp. GM17]
MRVALDYRPATVAPSSGIARQVKALEQALRAREDTELLLVSEAPLEHEQRQTAFCPAWPSPLDGVQRPGVRLRFERKFLPATIREQSVDLYIATANMGLPIGHKPAGTRYVLILHDLFQLTQRNFHRSQLKAVAYRLIDAVSIAWSIWVADEVWCPSRFSCSEAARLFPWARPKFRVLNNLVPEFQGVIGPLPTGLPERYWLAVGTREPRKNMPFFIEQWQRCRQENPQVPELVLVGHASDLPANLSQLPGLHWVNGVSDEQLQALYRHADCLWQPSYAEGFGLPVVEALWQGTPVAVARGSALDEVTPPGARRFNARDRASLRNALIEQAQDSARPDPDTLRDWARQFAEPAHRQRLDTLLTGLFH